MIEKPHNGNHIMIEKPYNGTHMMIEKPYNGNHMMIEKPYFGKPYNEVVMYYISRSLLAKVSWSVVHYYCIYALHYGSIK